MVNFDRAQTGTPDPLIVRSVRPMNWLMAMDPTPVTDERTCPVVTRVQNMDHCLTGLAEYVASIESTHGTRSPGWARHAARAFGFRSYRFTRMLIEPPSMKGTSSSGCTGGDASDHNVMSYPESSAESCTTGLIRLSHGASGAIVVLVRVLVLLRRRSTRCDDPAIRIHAHKEETVSEFDAASPAPD